MRIRPQQKLVPAFPFVRGLFLVLALFATTAAFAGPPFKTDDPEPVPWRHYEAYVFGTVDRGLGMSSWALPAFEFNVGAAPNLQLHVVIPGACLTPVGNYGIGDVELGAKYRFAQETGTRPEIGVFPLVELPTGNSRLGLGNGQIWARLPVWVQKSHGPWTTYGGVGYQINHSPGMKDSLFAGWLIQRQITRRLVLGTEIYHQEAQSVGARQATFADAGGYYNFRENLSLLFMLGHTVSGERHTTGYIGLYFTWGADNGLQEADRECPENSRVGRDSRDSHPHRGTNCVQRELDRGLAINAGQLASEHQRSDKVVPRMHGGE